MCWKYALSKMYAALCRCVSEPCAPSTPLDAICVSGFRSSRNILSWFFFHSSVMSETKAPSAEELAAVKLKNAQTKEGGAFDEAPYKAVWESSGGDGAKAAETIGLQGVPASYDEYIALVKSGKFKD